MVRSTQQGESHGGVYLVDLESGSFKLVIDWNDPAISWEGRGGDRGLRGIAFYRDRVYIAASDEIFTYDRKFNLIETCSNPYLKHSHEISISGHILYLTSTQINGILLYDLCARAFTGGYVISRHSPLRRFAAKSRWRALPFDPANTETGPSAKDEWHINSVSRCGDAIMIAGTRIDALLTLQEGELREYAPLPLGTHNAAAYRAGVLYNDTKSDRVVVADRKGRVEQSFAVPGFDDLPDITVSSDYARQRFARGLCSFENYLIAGSSPSTISVYDTRSGERIRTVNISRDIRNCIHGLEVWEE